MKDRFSGALGYMSGTKAPELPGPEDSPCPPAEVPEPPCTDLPDFPLVCSLGLQELGLPLRLYTAGNLCHPYLSLPYLDILTQPCIRGYTIGATNALFKAKKDLSHVVIDIDEDKLEITEPDLKRALNLTTEDLRFIDGIIRVVGEYETGGGGAWEGGDEWVRAQFRFYLVCLLRSSLEPAESGVMHLFHSHYMELLRETRFHRSWSRGPHPGALSGLVVGHPCSGAVGVADVKLRLANTMHNTDGGKKVTAAMANTGRVVGGAVTSAKGALSSWWGGIRGGERSKEGSPEQEKGLEGKDLEVKEMEKGQEVKELEKGQEKGEEVKEQVEENDAKEE